jgi:hypothetical protein
MMAILLAVMVEAAPVKVVAMSATAVGPQSSLTLEGSADWRALSVRRNGDEVLLTLTAEAEGDLEVPAARPPMEAIELERVPGELRLHVKVPPDVPYQVQRAGRQLTLVFQAPPRVDTSRTGLDLYRSLFPSRVDPADAAAEVAQLSAPNAEAYRGISLGPIRLQPALVLSYVDAEVAINGPAPVKDHYYRVEPRLGAQLVLLDGRVHARYEPHIRFGSSIGDVNVTSHDFDAGLDLPIGPALKLSASDQYTVTILDTAKADPGREYFFDLGRFTRNDIAGAAELQVGPDLTLRVGGEDAKVHFSETSSFFGYEQRRASAALLYTLREETRVGVVYGYEHLPAPASRPVAESTANTIGLTLVGNLPALIQGNVAVGFKEEHAPRAPGAGSLFRGMTASASLRREIGRGTRLTLEGGRETYVSGFEQNAFYVSSSTNAVLDVQLPLGFTGRGGAGYRWNEYRTEALDLGAPRRDRMFSWTVGAGRSVTRWSYLRLDYAHERRDSNIDRLDSHNHAFIIELGLTPFGWQESAK